VITTLMPRIGWRLVTRARVVILTFLLDDFTRVCGMGK